MAGDGCAQIRRSREIAVDKHSTDNERKVMAVSTVQRSWEVPREPRNVRSVIIVGLGPVGLAVLRATLADSRFNVVGCVDISSEAATAARDAGYEGHVYQDAAEIAGDADVAIVCTASTIAGINDLARVLLQSGCHVVSSCEELIAPQLGPVEIVSALHDLGIETGRAIAGTGVNPGFVMDMLPFIATAVTLNVEAITVSRRVDVSKRRQRLQEKVGVGISLDEFASRREAGQIGHVGLRASLVFLANGLGWFGESEETLKPVRSTDGRTSLGVHHQATVRDADGKVRVRGNLEMFAGADDLDEVKIHGTPSIQLEIPGGVSGDHATVAALVNLAARFDQLPVGLSTPADYLGVAWSAV